MATNITNRPVAHTLSVGGAIAVVFSAVVGLLVLFVIPGACTFVASLELLILAFLFVTGGLAFAVGKVLTRRRSRRKSPLEL